MKKKLSNSYSKVNSYMGIAKQFCSFVRYFITKIYMGKTACKNKDLIEKENPKYVCKKCDATVRKEKHVCKPKKIKKMSNY